MPDPRTLADLFRGGRSGVLVPMLQRDYAQGRPGEERVRKRFLASLREALLRPPGDALDLDFVYGHDRTESGAFVPIDGQQRLTTLFLLHWYLAARDGRAEEFAALVSGGGPGFRYEVRPSARRFFERLPTWTITLDALPAKPDALSKKLMDQPEAMLSWRRDPTVAAALVMLDAIHGTFARDRGLYERLVGPQPAVTFQFLPLERFGLGDDLYIKMNARGKRLTRFEVFKSELVDHLRVHPALVAKVSVPSELPVPDYVANRLDTTWLDVVWQRLRRAHEVADGDAGSEPPAWLEQLDPHLFNLTRAVALVATAVVDGSDVQHNRAIAKNLERLHFGEVDSFEDYTAVLAVSAPFVRQLVGLFDRWASGTPLLEDQRYYDAEAMFTKVRRDHPRKPGQRNKPKGSMSYPDWVCFAGWCIVLLQPHSMPAQAHDWMRVVRNLAVNSDLTSGEHLRSALASLRALTKADDILAYLAAHDAETKVPFFRREQVAEERIKARLIRRDSGWRTRLQEAEAHPYFTGQVGFMLELAGVLDALEAEPEAGWTADTDKDLQDAFDAVWTRVHLLFPTGGERTGTFATRSDFLVERAMLCHGNYLLRRNSNTSLLNDAGAGVSWKRFLRLDSTIADKRACFGAMLDRLNPNDLETSLQRVIDAGVRDTGDGTEGWRALLVEHPKLLRYCGSRALRFMSHGEVYLLKGVQRGEHRGVHTWALALTLKPLCKDGRLAPFSKVTAPKQWGRVGYPHLLLEVEGTPDQTLVVAQRDGRFRVRRDLAGLHSKDGWDDASPAMPADFLDWLRPRLTRA